MHNLGGHERRSAKLSDPFIEAEQQCQIYYREGCHWVTDVGGFVNVTSHIYPCLISTFANLDG